MKSQSLLAVLVVLFFAGELCQCKEDSLLHMIMRSLLQDGQTRFWMNQCDCPKLDRPTCGSKGDNLFTYMNRCYFECAQAQDPHLEFVSSSPCDHQIP